MVTAVVRTANRVEVASALNAGLLDGIISTDTLKCVRAIYASQFGAFTSPAPTSGEIDAAALAGAKALKKAVLNSLTKFAADNQAVTVGAAAAVVFPT